MTVLIEEGSRAAVEPAHLRQLHTEIAEILAAIPHDQLAIQWDVCQDVGIWEGYYPAYFDDPRAGRHRAPRRLRRRDPRRTSSSATTSATATSSHKHFMEPERPRRLHQITNRLTAAAPRAIDCIHVPVPIDRDDDAYFAPLAALALDPRDELYLGPDPLRDGVEGARRRIAAARRHAAGLRRRRPSAASAAAHPETIAPLLALHAEVAGAARRRWRAP